MSKQFTCPYCNKPTTATEPHIFNQEIEISLQNSSKLGVVYLIVDAISCPNPDCNQLYLRSFLANKNWIKSVQKFSYNHLFKWQLLPESEAKVLPEYVPSVIKEDYYEACRIRDLSPKASATLSRRVLQGMIRDFWGISMSKLKYEVDALEEKVDSLTWEAIDSVRKVGNIGAHMEKDINIIIEVEPDEAQLLIGLVEQLVYDWYVARYEKEQRLKKIKEMAESKEKDKEAITETAS